MVTEKIRALLDAVTDRVFAYKPKYKGLAALKTKRKLARKAKKEADDDRELSI